MITIELVKEFKDTDGKTLNNQTDLVDFFTLDSLGIFELIVYLEEKTNLELFNNDIDIENIKNIDSLNKFIENIK